MQDEHWQEGDGSEDRADLAIASTFALSGMEPLRMVIHYDDGTWGFLCGTTAEAEQHLTVHASHMFQRFGFDLFHVRDLPRGHIAERDEAGHDWSISPYVEGDDESDLP